MIYGSPSSRRAWIEIARSSAGVKFPLVALLAEGVDRNSTNSESTICRVQSPSSRRAWIEITLEASYLIIERVALLAEGVDRNSIDLR